MKVLIHHTKEATRHVGKHTVRFFFPYVWHYFTDEYKDKGHHLIIDTIFAFIMLGLVLANMILGYRLYDVLIPPQMTVQVRVSPEAVSGDVLPVEVSVYNISRVVKNVHVEVLTPTGYTTEDPLELDYPKMNIGDRQEVTYDGYFVGNVDQRNRFIVSYSYEHFGQEFVGVAYAETTIIGSTFEVVPNLPETILNNEPVTWTVDYRNSSALKRTGTCITIELPESFVLETSSRELDENGTTCFKKIKPFTQGSIELTGTFSNAIGEGKHVVQVSATDGVGTTVFNQSSVEAPIRVLTPRLAIATTGKSVVNVGEAVRYTNSYTNTGDAPLRNVAITTNLQGVAERSSYITPESGSRAGNTLTWIDPEIMPGETHYRSFVVGTNPSMREQNASMSYSSSATAQIDSLDISTYTPVTGQSAKFNSTLDFQTLSRYYLPSGEQIGYGPNPMQANAVTAVRVFWEIQDFTNDMSNVTISTTLPSQVEWTGLSSVTEGSAVSYNPATRTVTWSTGSIPSFSHAQGAQFEVRVLPNHLQVEQPINITNATFFNATDSYTGGPVSRVLGALRSSPIVAEVTPE